MKSEKTTSFNNKRYARGERDAVCSEGRAVKCAVCSVQCAVYIVLCAVQCNTVFSVQLTVCSVQCTVCSVQCTVCSVQCTVYSVQCVIYSALYIVWPRVLHCYTLYIYLSNRCYRKTVHAKSKKIFPIIIVCIYSSTFASYKKYKWKTK